MINDQAAGLGGKAVAGTPRDSLYVLDVLYDRDGGKRPEMIVTDTASCSDIVNMLGRYSFQLPDLPGGPRPLRDRDAVDEEYHSVMGVSGQDADDPSRRAQSWRRIRKPERGLRTSEVQVNPA